MPSLTPPAKDHSPSTQLLAVITAVVVIAGLYFGKDLVIPFALALLLSFLLGTPVSWLERLRLGRTLSVLVVLATAFLLTGGLIWLGVQQLNGMAQDFPQYQAHIVRKLELLRNPAGLKVLNIAQNLNQLKDELTAHRLQAEGKRYSLSSDKGRQKGVVLPVPVEIVKPGTGILSSLGFVSTSIVHYLGLVGAVVILTLFILLNRGHLRNRLFRLFGQGHLVLMTTALDEAAQKVSRYLLTQSLVNTCFGTLLGVGLWTIGVPYAPFWGVLAAFLRFIPYVGTFLAGVCPFVLSLAVFDGWSKPALTIVLFIAIEGITSGAVEPWLYATRTGVSSLAILLSAAFWTLLWGPIGLILSTPLTVCLAVLGRHAPSLAFLHVVLGDEPVLTPDICYYQRLLAMDEEEATELAETYLKEKTLIELYDNVLIPALGLAEQDRHDNRLEENRVRFLYRSTRDLLDEFVERATPDHSLSAPPASVLCIPVRDEADELVGMMLAQTLQESGWNAHCLSLGQVDDILKPSSKKAADVIVISALPPFAILPARALCRKLRRSHPELKLVLGIWNAAVPAEKIKERLGPQCTDAVITSLQEAKTQLYSMLAPPDLVPQIEAEAERRRSGEIHVSTP
ncbi:MAG: AI-2E family transporter [Acidobacteriaceae bacterium]|nr:AI-2E family transporter [Acidobacteriaceae bacterium]